MAERAGAAYAESIRGSAPIRAHGRAGGGKYMGGLLWAIIVVLVVFWILGFALHVGGSLIHLLIVVALVLFIVNMMTGRRSSV
jgi:hypothetical protein